MKLSSLSLPSFRRINLTRIFYITISLRAKRYMYSHLPLQSVQQIIIALNIFLLQTSKKMCVCVCARSIFSQSTVHAHTHIMSQFIFIHLINLNVVFFALIFGSKCTNRPTVGVCTYSFRFHTEHSV